MSGMNGADATISGAFDAYTYAIDYTRTDGGELARTHKCVVQEELEGAGEQLLANGTLKTILANHINGMGAEVTIVSSTDETAYMVDIDEWVVESEIDPRF